MIVRDAVLRTTPYHPDDAACAAALFETCGLNPAEVPTAGDLARALLVTVPEAGGVAYAHLNAGTAPHTRLTLWTVVHPAHVGQGVRGILLGWAEDEARDTLLELAPPAARVSIVAWATPGTRRCYTFAGFEPLLDEGIATLMEKEIRAGE